MENSRKLAGLGLICFLLFALLSLPARIPLQLLASDTVSFSGVRGTVWRTSINAINLPGMQLRSTEWDLSLLRLLRGQIGGDVKSRWGGGFLEGTVAVSLLGTVSAENMQINTTVGWLAGAIGLSGVGGQVSVSLDLLELVGNWPTELVGRIRVGSLSSTLISAGADGLLGNVVAEFDSARETTDGVLTGIIRDEGGPLALDGKLILMRPDSYTLNVQVTERANASAILRQSLQFLGSPNANGARRFEMSGNL